MKNILIKICLVFSSLFFCFTALEFALRIGFFNQLNSPNPVWIPYKYTKIDEEINFKNTEFSKKNSLGFNDRERDAQKKSGSYRIAVIGDSCVWGHGLSYEDIWSHKLEDKLTEYSEKIEVLSWGRCGWSTRDEFNFLKNEGIKYGLNLLIISFGTNDPDMGDYPLKCFHLHRRKAMAPIRKIFPNAIDFTSGLLDSVIDRFFKDWGYANWKEKLYTDINLAKYSQLLKEFSNFCNTGHIDLLFVLVPNNHNIYFKEKFNKIKPVLEKNHIAYIDTYPAVARILASYKERQLWANPGNGHPGRLVTEVVANEVFRYFIEENADKKPRPF